MTIMIDAAMEWARGGCKIFPCKPDKAPYVRDGFKSATNDFQKINTWWTQWPDAMIGLPTGAVNGLWVLDVDRPKKEGDPDGMVSLKELVGKHGTLQETLVVVTPSEGVHYYFLMPPDGLDVPCSASKLGPKLDVRGNGGYVIAPPSVSGDGRAYQLGKQARVVPAPQWLVNLARGEKLETMTTPNTGHDAWFGLHPYVQEALDAECSKVAAAAEGGRNEQLNKSAFALGQLVAGGGLDEATTRDRLMKAAEKCGLPADEAEKTIASGFAAGAKEPRSIPVSTADATDAATGNVSEESVATSFTAERKDSLRYCKAWGQWLILDPACNIWQPDQVGTVEHDIREAIKKVNPTNKVSLGRSSMVKGVEKFLKTDPAHATKEVQWDADPYIIGTPSGPVHLDPLKKIQDARQCYVTKSTAVSPIEGDCPRWKQFLYETTGADAGLIRYLQQIAGYCLTGDTTAHSLFFIYGPGGNGKSVFLNTLLAILGDYAMVTPTGMLTATQGDRHPTELAMLRGARLVALSETDAGRPWKESLLKSLTGGDPITARFLNREFFTYQPQFKLIVVGNHKPRLLNLDAAMRRRIHILPFTQQPKKPDQQLEAKLRAEWPQILVWMMGGLWDYQQNGFVVPTVVDHETNEYFKNQDVFQQWFDECCEVGRQGDGTPAMALFTRWKMHAESVGESPGNQVRFAEQMNRLGFQSKHTRKENVYVGVTLRTNNTGSSGPSQFDDSSLNNIPV